MLTAVIAFSKFDQKTKYYENLESIVLPSFYGKAQILTGHAEAFMILKRGEIIFSQNGRRNTLAIDSGECHVKDNIVTIIL